MDADDGNGIFLGLLIEPPDVVVQEELVRPAGAVFFGTLIMGEE